MINPYITEGAKTIAVDFDGVIHSATYPEFKEPNADVVRTLRYLKKHGWKIMIFTARICDRWYNQSDVNYAIYTPPTVHTIQSYMKQWNIPYDEIWTGKGKPYCKLYIDDSAIHYQKGMDLLSTVKRRLPK